MHAASIEQISCSTSVPKQTGRDNSEKNPQIMISQNYFLKIFPLACGPGVVEPER